jgi:hypothetical protein
LLMGIKLVGFGDGFLEFKNLLKHQFPLGKQTFVQLTAI